MTQLDRLLRSLQHPGMPWEVATLAGCLLAAFGIAWLIGRRRTVESVWFGRAVVDGVLFPLVALVLVYGASFAIEIAHRAVLLRIAIPMLIALAGIRLLARVLTVVFPASRAARLLERIFSWVAWIAAVLWILGLLPVVMAEMDAVKFTLGKSKITLLSLLQGVLACGVVVVVTLWVSKTIERQVLREAVHDLSLRKAASNVIRAALVLTGLLLVLSAVGVDLTALSVFGGAIGVGLGFGLQKLAANYVSGFVILFERSLRIGDTVRVDKFEGIVADIKTRYTLIRSLTGHESIVPNEKLITERIENLSLADPKIMLTTSVSVSYDSDPDEVQRVLLEAATSSKRVLTEPGPAVRLVEFGADGLNYSVYFWIADPANGQLNVQSDINLAILKGLRAAGIEIPYPQRVVRLVQPDAGVTSSARAATN